MDVHVIRGKGNISLALSSARFLHRVSRVLLPVDSHPPTDSATCKTYPIDAKTDVS